MLDLVNLASVDADVIDLIHGIVSARKIAHLYVEKPTKDNGDLLALSVDEMTNQIDNLRVSLAIMVKRANGVDTEIVGKETDIGIQLP